MNEGKVARGLDTIDKKIDNFFKPVDKLRGEAIAGMKYTYEDVSTGLSNVMTWLTGGDNKRGKDGKISDTKEENERILNAKLKNPEWGFWGRTKNFLHKAWDNTLGVPEAEGMEFGPGERTKHKPQKFDFKGGISEVSDYFESGGAGAGTVSSGVGDPGGRSYGTHQLSSVRGSVANFLRSSPQYAAQFQGMQVNSPEFVAKWKEIADSDANFGKAQDEFAQSQYYDVQMNKLLSEDGIDLTKRGKAVQSMVYSTAIQYGPNTGAIARALRNRDLSKMSDSDIISLVMRTKARSIPGDFRSSPPHTQAAVADRISQEHGMLLGIEKKEKYGNADLSITPLQSTQPGQMTPFQRMMEKSVASDTTNAAQQAQAARGMAVMSSANNNVNQSSVVNNTVISNTVTGLRHSEDALARSQDSYWSGQ